MAGSELEGEALRPFAVEVDPLVVLGVDGAADEFGVEGGEGLGVGTVQDDGAQRADHEEFLPRGGPGQVTVLLHALSRVTCIPVRSGNRYFMMAA